MIDLFGYGDLTFQAQENINNWQSAMVTDQGYGAYVRLALKESWQQ